MKITKVRIENFKSIESMEIPFDKNGNSFTKIFVGVNESGKSNILEALSYFDAPEKEVSFDHFCNQKLEESNLCKLIFSLDFEDEEEKASREYVKNLIQDEFEFVFSISNIEKVVYLKKGSTKFKTEYNYNVNLGEKDLFISEQSDGTFYIEKKIIADSRDTALNEDNFDDYFYDAMSEYIEMHEPLVSVWKPSKKYLLYDADLNSFKEDIETNKPLYNIFKLSGYSDRNSIKEAIEKISDARFKSRMESKLNDSINDYLEKVWKHNIDLLIEIDATGKFSLLIRDKGDENKHDRFSITDRSQGAQQFLSIILSLSLETENHDRKNELILIDEPEVHLHPSGIRDLSRELLKIGQENYVFLATHSPFMIDKNHKDRHFIVKKNNKAITELKRIKESDNIIDDEVLRDAFGIDVYKDLLNPHSILVEGASDKIILQKVFACLDMKNIGITNGHGNNITTVVSKFNHDNIFVLVVLDDDEDGKKDKRSILKTGGIYTEENVFTIRDLVGDIVNMGTIEDVLDVEFVKTQFNDAFRKIYGEDSTIEFEVGKPILKQITVWLKTKRLYSRWDMDLFKKQLSEIYCPTKKALLEDSNLLGKLAKEIEKRLTK